MLPRPRQSQARPPSIAVVKLTALVSSLGFFVIGSWSAAQDSTTNQALNLNTNQAVVSDPSAAAPTQPSATPADDQTVLELNQQISQRRQKIDELTKQAEAFDQTIRVKEREAFSVARELSVIDDRIAATDLNLQTTATEIEKIELEIQLLEEQLRQKEQAIGTQRDRLSELLRRLYRERQRSMLEVAIVESTFADFFSSLQYLTALQEDARDNLEQLKALRQDLTVAQEDLTGKQVTLRESAERLTVLKDSLDDQHQYKTTVLVESQRSQAKFETLLADIRTEADAVNAEIATLEKRVREKLGQTGGPEAGRLGSGPFAWPVDPSRGITAYFHDPTYPFRCTTKNQRNCIGEHPAIDIRASQGTPVVAAGDGYVAIARRLDWVRNETGQILRSAYNYVTLIHADGLATVYGHLSAVKVVEDTYVTKGQVVGLSGGLPGTAGAGTWTTGSHLHFEVRQEGIPQDPLPFLP